MFRLFLMLAVGVAVGLLSNGAQAQNYVVVGPPVAVYRPAPVAVLPAPAPVTVYRPAVSAPPVAVPSPVRVYRPAVPAPIYAAPPAVVPAAPVYVDTDIYVPGQPIRNLLRALGP